MWPLKWDAIFWFSRNNSNDFGAVPTGKCLGIYSASLSNTNENEKLRNALNKKREFEWAPLGNNLKLTWTWLIAKNTRLHIYEWRAKEMMKMILKMEDGAADSTTMVMTSPHVRKCSLDTSPSIWRRCMRSRPATRRVYMMVTPTSMQRKANALLML